MYIIDPQYIIWQCVGGWENSFGGLTAVITFRQFKHCLQLHKERPKFPKSRKSMPKPNIF